MLAGQYRHALDRGDEASLPFLLYHFSELECWAGNWDAAEEYALEGCRVAEESRQQPMRPATLYCLALVRAHRGQVDAGPGTRERGARPVRTDRERPGRLAGALRSRVPRAVARTTTRPHTAHLGRLAEATAAVGLGEPSVVKFLPDEIEALAALGQLDRARSFTRQLEARGKSLGRPWALATGARCRAHLAAIDGDLQGARAACEQALSQHEQLPMPFELGRTLLVKGMIERRARHKSAARDVARPGPGHLRAPRRAAVGGQGPPGALQDRDARSVQTGSPTPSAASPPWSPKARPTGRSPPRCS